ncbi:NAD(P)H-dependent oxidoreductase [Rhizobium grahamii]|uniref:NAD(P)H-dependent oxidoreductase n=1 Tax=Rhizobium grahamii TaxID=1120045 RepID=A0A5Q0C651_9HYPH|nr:MULTISPECIES: NADPH-dependent FMN reductase [Rhizobium]QFY61406.1 NAD(P)H-dependent oxidoreductase [Rhizobium grahamii]QRM49443.1 NAD(P)H-dependent oxidoreductase [Rhizobium sp. BG6]
MEKPFVLYALCGSQRKASTNRRLLEALRDNAPAGVAIEISELIGELPIFNSDREGENTPAIVEAFAAKIGAADGLIVACPEYAHGLPGGLKNALDWLVSRDEVPFKPVMIVHASHRGDFALEQLTEVLRTMSLRLVDEAFLRIPLLGKSDDAQVAMLGGLSESERLSTAIAEFRSAICSGRIDR